MPERYGWGKPVPHTFINPDSIFIHGSGVNCGPCGVLRRYGELLLNGNTPPVGMHFWGDCILHQLWIEIKIAGFFRITIGDGTGFFSRSFFMGSSYQERYVTSDIRSTMTKSGKKSLLLRLYLEEGEVGIHVHNGIIHVGNKER